MGPQRASAMEGSCAQVAIDAPAERSWLVGGRLQSSAGVMRRCLSARALLASITACVEWIPLMIALVAVLAGVVEFSQLHHRVVAVKLSLGELQNLLVWWDSLPVLRRRTDATKARVVESPARDTRLLYVELRAVRRPH